MENLICMEISYVFLLVPHAPNTILLQSLSNLYTIYVRKKTQIHMLKGNKTDVRYLKEGSKITRHLHADLVRTTCQMRSVCK